MIIMLMSQEIIHLGIYIHSSLGKVNRLMSVLDLGLMLMKRNRVMVLTFHALARYKVINVNVCVSFVKWVSAYYLIQGIV